MAQALAEAGVENLALFDINKELGDKVAQELHEQTGCHVAFYEVDIRTDGAMSAAIQDVVAKFGDLHILINSAGIAE
jgi:NAD(P)-dependent dehydrogenase (short-subunit alcohol dehydrogenase family)